MELRSLGEGSLKHVFRSSRKDMEQDFRFSYLFVRKELDQLTQQQRLQVDAAARGVTSVEGKLQAKGLAQPKLREAE